MTSSSHTSLKHSSPSLPSLPASSPIITSPHISHDTTDNQGHDHDQSIDEYNLIPLEARFTKHPLHFLRQVSLHFSGSGWRSYDKVIGQPIFYEGFGENLKRKILSSESMIQCFDKLARDSLLQEYSTSSNLLHTQTLDNSNPRFLQIRQNLIQTANSILDNILCRMESKRFIRSAYFLIARLITKTYHQGIHVSSEEVLRLTKTAEFAEKHKIPIIFIPSHKSHVDYISLQLICYRLSIALPTVIAGDNLNFPIVGPFLQNAGAMWIKRSFDPNDKLYSPLFQSSVNTILESGYNLECFIEGGRSRTGKLLPPKYGVLSFILESVLSRRVSDVIVCPVSTQYDKVIELDSYISELMGKPKEKENLFQFISSSSRILSKKLGRIDVRFHEPWSMREYVDNEISRYLIVGSSCLSIPFPASLKPRLLRSLGYRLLSNINDISVIMPTSLISTILLTIPSPGISKSHLINLLNTLRTRIQNRSGKLSNYNLNQIDDAIALLHPDLIGIRDTILEPTYYPLSPFQLSFYRNMIIHLFIVDAIVCVSLNALLTHNSTPLQQLLPHLSFLSYLFSTEFVFPQPGFYANLRHSLTILLNEQVLQISPDVSPSSTNLFSPIHNPPILISLHHDEVNSSRQNFCFFCSLVWPFIESYWLAAVSLVALSPPTSSTNSSQWLDLKKLLTSLQSFGQSLFHQGQLSTYEAINQETLKNALHQFESEGIVQIARRYSSMKSPNALPQPSHGSMRPSVIIQLSPSYQRITPGYPNPRLTAFAERINIYRKHPLPVHDLPSLHTLLAKLSDSLYGQIYPLDSVSSTLLYTSSAPCPPSALVSDVDLSEYSISSPTTSNSNRPKFSRL